MTYAAGIAWCVICTLKHQPGVGLDFSTLKVTKLTTKKEEENQAQGGATIWRDQKYKKKKKNA